jgi:hypothetical protein
MHIKNRIFKVIFLMKCNGMIMRSYAAGPENKKWRWYKSKRAKQKNRPPETEKRCVYRLPDLCYLTCQQRIYFLHNGAFGFYPDKTVYFHPVF